MFVFVDCLTNWREVFATPDYNHLLLWSGYRWKKFVSHHGVPSKVLEDEDRGKAFLSSVRVNKEIFSLNFPHPHTHTHTHTHAEPSSVLLVTDDRESEWS